LILFSDSNLEAEDDSLDAQDEDAEKLSKIIESISKYINWNFLALFFSCSLLLQFFFKTLFNNFASKKIPYDKWTIMDTLCGSLNIIAVVAISNVKPEVLLNTVNKEILDYFMILVLCVCYLRFFTYFLVMKSLAKLLLILVAMLADTIAFLFILTSFIIIMSSIFTTLYQNSYPELFGNLAITARFLFDAVIG
jgi:vacuolar-type H+-ATPase subunit I/STV1